MEDRSFWFKHRNRVILELVGRFHRGGTFLDIGGGNGYVARALDSAGVDCALIEPGVDGAFAAHARGIDPVICASLEDAGLPSCCAASIGLFDVLEHMGDEHSVLRHIHSLLEPMGRLFITVPSYQFLFSSEDEAAGHFRRYTISSLHRVLAKSKLRIEFSSYFFAPLPPLIFLNRTIPTRLGLSRSNRDQIDCSEHAPGRAASWLIDRTLNLELQHLRAGRRCLFGGSCVCVAVRE